MNIDIELVAKNILLARTIKDYSQEGLANKLEHSQQWLQKVEKAEIDLCLKQINKICEVLEVSPQFLLFTTPSLVFSNSFNSNGSSESNNSNKCAANTPEIVEKIATLQKLFETFLSKNSLIVKNN